MTILSNLFVGIMIAVVTSIITVQLALKRFRSERWWERKADAYSTIVESLHHMKRYCEEVIEELESHKDMPEKDSKALYVKFKEATEEIAKAKDVGSFIISNEAVLQLEVLQKGLYSANMNDGPYDYYEERLTSITSCLDSIRKIARSDLKVE